MLFGRVVDQNIDLAELLHGLFHSFSTEPFLADITCDQQASAPCFYHQTLGFIRVLVLFKVQNRNVRIFFCKGTSNCAADPAVAASNDRYFISQFSSTAMCFVLCSRPRFHFVFTARLSLLMLSWRKLLPLGHPEIFLVSVC